MKKMKRTSTLEKVLNIGSQEDKCNFDMLLFEGDHNKVANLIKKYENLVTKLKSAGDSGLEDILSRISKLKSILSKIHKKNQRKLIDEHWEKMKKGNDDFLKVISKQLDRFRKQLSIKNLF